MAQHMTVPVVENNDFDERFRLTENNLPLDLTGRTVEAYVRESRVVEDVDSLALTVGSGLTLVDIPGGIVDVSMTWAQVQFMRHLRIDVISAGKRKTHVIAYLNHEDT